MDFNDPSYRKLLDQVSGADLRRMFNQLSGSGADLRRMADQLSGADLRRTIDQLSGADLRRTVDQLSGSGASLTRAIDQLTAADIQRTAKQLSSPAIASLEFQRRFLSDVTAKAHLTSDAYLASLATARQPWQHLPDFRRDHRLHIQSAIEFFGSQQEFVNAQSSVYLLSQQYLETAGASLAVATGLSRLAGATRAISRSYESLIQAVSSLDPQTLPPLVYDVPPLDVTGHADFVRICIEPPQAQSSSESEGQSEHQLLITELRDRVGDQLEPRLGMLHHGLPKLWTGAREALRSSNPDRCRHAAVSTRELVTHLLHLLAPDDSVRQWTSQPDHYDEKRRPTRRARFLYICRCVPAKEYAGFVKAIVDGTLAKLNLLHKGTHQIEASMEERQIEALWLSVGGDLLLLIESASSSL